jgi:hypothetical protein
MAGKGKMNKSMEYRKQHKEKQRGNQNFLKKLSTTPY